MIVMRPVIPVGKELGYLPGSLEEQMAPWLAPIEDSIEILHPDKDMLKEFKAFGWVEIQVISYIRGRSIPNKFIIVDEIQNLNKHEVKTIVSRAGKGTKIVVTGDPYQIDNPYLDKHSNGLTHLIDSLKGEGIFAYITLLNGERSELAQLAADKL